MILLRIFPLIIYLFFPNISYANSCRSLLGGLTQEAKFLEQVQTEYLANMIPITLKPEHYQRMANDRIILRRPQVGMFNAIADKQEFLRRNKFSTAENVMMADLIDHSNYQINSESKFREVGAWVIYDGEKVIYRKFTSGNGASLETVDASLNLKTSLDAYSLENRGNLEISFFHTHPFSMPLLSKGDFTVTRKIALEAGLNLSLISVHAISEFEDGSFLVGRIKDLSEEPIRPQESRKLPPLPFIYFR